MLPEWVEVVSGLIAEVFGLGAMFRGGFYEHRRRRNHRARAAIPALEIELGLREDPAMALRNSMRHSTSSLSPALYNRDFGSMPAPSPMGLNAPRRQRSKNQRHQDSDAFPGNRSWRL